jgi:hypothetical protein
VKYVCNLSDVLVYSCMYSLYCYSELLDHNIHKTRAVPSGFWLGGGGEIKNLGPLPFGGPLRKFFSETKEFFRKVLGRGRPQIFSNTRFT